MNLEDYKQAYREIDSREKRAKNLIKRGVLPADQLRDYIVGKHQIDALDKERTSELIVVRDLTPKAFKELIEKWKKLEEVLKGQ